MIKAAMGERIDALIQRVFPFLFRRPLNPNLFSVIGVLIYLNIEKAQEESTEVEVTLPIDKETRRREERSPSGSSPAKSAAALTG